MKMNYKTYHVTKDGEVYNRHGKRMKGTDNGKGYLIVGITDSGVRTTKAIHRLVAEVYLPNPNGLTDVHHIDNDRTNNTVGNLQWVTHGENIKHSFDSCNRSATGESNAHAKHTDEEVHDICYLLSIGWSSPRIRDAGYGYNTVRSIKHRKKWLHISSLYSF